MQSIVECVPNFSNGRDPEVYGAIVEAISSVAAVQVLDVSADPDHNRTVVTFVGPPDDVVEAGYRGIAKAKELVVGGEFQFQAEAGAVISARRGGSLEDDCAVRSAKGPGTIGGVDGQNRLICRQGSCLLLVCIDGDAAVRPVQIEDAVALQTPWLEAARGIQAQAEYLGGKNINDEGCARIQDEVVCNHGSLWCWRADGQDNATVLFALTGKKPGSGHC